LDTNLGGDGATADADDATLSPTNSTAEKITQMRRVGVTGSAMVFLLTNP
jgi:hypothetical protein